MSARNLHQDMTEAERRMSNVALKGRVVELDAVRARVRVQAGAITTGWLPFVTARAGHDRTWHAPEPGEQVLVLSPCGDLNQGVVVGSIYRAEHPAPANRPRSRARATRTGRCWSTTARSTTGAWPCQPVARSCSRSAPAASK